MKKFLIFSNYKNREIDYLILLKKIIEKKFNKSKTYIVGGLGEEQLMYYRLHQIKPDVVFIPQTLEKACRSLARYILDSGALIYVIPAEITIIPAIEELLLNPDIAYNTFFSKIFIPGKRYKKLLDKTDVANSKIKLTGSPKIDFLVRGDSQQFYSRKDFCNKYSLDSNKKNIFIFTSFVTISEEYIKSDTYFNKTMKQLIKSNNCVTQTKKKYIESISKLCEDFTDFNIILKPHPLGDSTDYKKIIADNFLLLEDAVLYNCLNSIDIAIHWSSTVSSECWIRDIKTIQYAPYKKFDSFLSECYPGNPVVRNYNELKDSILHYLNNKFEVKYLRFQKQYLKENFYKIDGKGVDRIADIVNSDLSKTKRKIQYKKSFSNFVYPIIILQSIFGLRISRKIVKLFLRDFDSKAAINDYVYMK